MKYFAIFCCVAAKVNFIEARARHSCDTTLINDIVHVITYKDMCLIKKVKKNPEKIPNGFTLSDDDILSNPLEDSNDDIQIDPFNKTMCEIRESLEIGVCVDVKGSNK